MVISDVYLYICCCHGYMKLYNQFSFLSWLNVFKSIRWFATKIKCVFKIVNQKISNSFKNKIKYFVQAEGFLVLGLLAKNSEEQRSLISNDRCKWCNHVTMALSELRAHVDVVENGVMSLAYLFSNSNTVQLLNIDLRQ